MPASIPMAQSTPAYECECTAGDRQAGYLIFVNPRDPACTMVSTPSFRGLDQDGARTQEFSHDELEQATWFPSRGSAEANRQGEEKVVTGVEIDAIFDMHRAELAMNGAATVSP